MAGIDAELLDGRNHPCPRCGGTDRFSLVDADAGAVLCRQCFASKNGDGLAAVAWALECSFPEALALVADYLGLVGTNGAPTRKPAAGKSAGKTYATARAAVAELERQFGPRSAMWTYRDAHGEPVGVVLRWNLPGGDKDIRPASRNGKGWRIGGMPEPRPLYGLPQLAGAERVYVCEGEKAADAARTIGLTATTSPHGARSARKADWRPLAGKSIILLPDNDPAGTKYAADVATELAKLKPAPVVRVVTLPNLPEAGDIADWLAAHDAAEPDDLRGQIEALAAAAQPIEPTDNDAPAKGAPVLVRLSEVTPEPVEWLWPQRIAVGKLTLVVGDPGLGKSFLTLSLSAGVSRGWPWPDLPHAEQTAGGVVLLSAEDDVADTIRPRLDAAGADVTRITALQSVDYGTPKKSRKVTFSLSRDLPALDSAITATPGCRMVVIDPISAYLDGTDSHANADIRGLLAPLAELAQRRRVAVVLVSHLNKTAGGPAIYRATGSLAFVAAARAAWLVAKDRDNPSRRLFLPLKNNLAADSSGLAYGLMSGCVAWERDPVTITADEALAPKRGDGRGAEKGKEAEKWLRERLAKGEAEGKRLLAEALDAGHAEKTLRRAAKAVGVCYSKRGFGAAKVTWWVLPEADAGEAPDDAPFDAPLDGQAPVNDQVATYGEDPQKQADSANGGQTDEMATYGADHDAGDDYEEGEI